MNNQLIHRTMEATLSEAFKYLPTLTITGPRQSGKTTLCRTYLSDLPYVNLEDYPTLEQLQNDPKGFIARFPNGVIIDEAQRWPQLFSYLQVEVDNDRINGGSRRFIVSDSSNFALLEKVTQSMAGRTAVLTLLPLTISEIRSRYPEASTDELLLRGGFPALWGIDLRGVDILLSNYFATYIERDVRSLLNIKDLHAFQTFLRLCAGRIGQEFNASAMSVEVGVSVPTIKSWLSVLQASYVVTLLQPYYQNIGKQLTKSPKLYFCDCGLAAWLLGIRSTEQMALHPLRGNLFENMVVTDLMKTDLNRGLTNQFFFYRDKTRREVDLLRILPDGHIQAFEIKSGKTYTPQYAKHLNYLRDLLGERVQTTAVIYDGGENNFAPFDCFANCRQAAQLLKD
ncbi:MAG: ATP-binding protein [Muribaculaceae bacterium]